MDYKTSIQQLIAFLIRQKLIKDIEERYYVWEQKSRLFQEVNFKVYRIHYFFKILQWDIKKND